MNDNFTGQTPAGSKDGELAENADEFRISDLPPHVRGHNRLLKPGWIQQRLLYRVTNVSRATLQAAAPIDDKVQRAEGAEQAMSEKLDIEISDLPPTQRSHYLLLKLVQLRLGRARARKSTPLTRSLRRHRTRRVFTAFGICAALLLLLLGNVPGLRTRLVGLLEPTPAPTATADAVFTNMPIVINHFGTVPPYSSQSSPGPLPATCPQVSTLQYFTTPLDPPGLGASPLWLSGFTGPSAALDDLVPINAQVAHAPWPGGWYESIAVFIQKGYTGNIILHGGSQKNGAPVWLSKSTPQILGNTLTLNLEDGSHFIANGPWEMTSITIAVPAAGCYALQASWANSSWTRFFAAGR